MRQIAYIVLILLLIIPAAGSQDTKAFKRTFLDGEFYMMTEEYQEALIRYNELLETNTDNANLNFLAGACYLSLPGEKHKAIPHLEIAVQAISTGYREGSYKEKGAPREALFALARAYQINNEFDRAIEQYETYKNVMFKRNFADIEYVNHQIKSCELGKSMITKPVDVKLLNIGPVINQFASNYNPVVSLNDSVIIYMADKNLTRAIMISQLGEKGWSKPKDITREMGSEGDCYPTCLSRDGRELYLVKKNYYESDIYVSRMEGGRWTAIEALNQNINTDYYESHASISLSGKILLFTSDRPGGQGALDIWMSVRSSVGDWLPAVNLGDRINSHYNEETPFFTENEEKIYFSSQGHATMGGYDIFVSERLPGTRWSFPVNLGYPISSSDDDLFYVPRSNGWRAYFSTIPDSLEGGQKIYAMRINPAEDVQISMRKQGEQIDTDSVREDITATLAEAASDTIITKRIVPGPVEADEYFILNSLMFDFDSDNLNENAKKEADRVYEVLRKHPALELELTGHTDAVGSDTYNLELSHRRAKSVATYLTGKGIDPGRLHVAGLGESNPLAMNVYEDGSDSPDGRKLNRHVSLKLQNLQDEKIKVAEIFVPDALKPRSERSYTVMLIESESFLDTVPDKVFGEPVALIITDEFFLYTAGSFNQKHQAMTYLNVVIDGGYDDAGMLEQTELERMIAGMSDGKLTIESSYTIQIMALKNPVDVSYFKPLTGVLKYSGKDGLHRYVQGEYKTIDEALKRLPAIKEMGYEDAFIMSVLRYPKVSE